MVIKTTSTAYDNDGNVIASYDNEKSFNAEDVEDVIKKFKQKHEEDRESKAPNTIKEEDCQHDEPCCRAEEDGFDDENGVDVIGIDISVDTLKTIGVIAGGLVGLRVLRKLAKAVL